MPYTYVYRTVRYVASLESSRIGLGVLLFRFAPMLLLHLSCGDKRGATERGSRVNGGHSHNQTKSAHNSGFSSQQTLIMLNCVSFKSIKYIGYTIWIWLTEFCRRMYVFCWVMKLWRNVPRIVSRKK